MAHKKKAHAKEKSKSHCEHGKVAMVQPMAHEKGKGHLKPMKHSGRGK